MRPCVRGLAARAGPHGIVGLNVGANKDAADRVADYAAGIEAFAGLASYFTVNVSSPNTPGLRDLQQAAALDDLLARVMDARERFGGPADARAAQDRTRPDAWRRSTTSSRWRGGARSTA